MVWVSNHTAEPIDVSITNKTGGDGSNFTVLPAIPYHGLGAPETWENNHWERKGAETLTAKVGGKEVKFEVQKDDHVNIYVDTYEIFTTQTTYF